MNPKRLFQVENWLQTPADRDVIARWTRTPPAGDPTPVGQRYTLTLPTPPPLSATDHGWEFLVLGDSGDADAGGPGVTPQDAVAQEMARDAVPPAGNGRSGLVLHVGDVVYMTGEHRLYERNFRRPYAPFLTPESTVDNLVFRVPFLPVPGNHDYYDLGGWAKWVARIPLLAPGLRAVAHEIFAFGLPEGGSDMGRAYMEAFVDQGAPSTGGTIAYSPGAETRLPNRYYQFTVGGADFFALDSNTLDAPHPYADRGSVQREAAEHIEHLEKRARLLEATLERAQRRREERRRLEREALVQDASRLAASVAKAQALSAALTMLDSRLHEAQKESGGSLYGVAAQAVGSARRRWSEGTSDLEAAHSPDAALRAMKLLDDAGDLTCRALLDVEEYLGTLPSGSGARAHLTEASDAVGNAQSEYATVTEPLSREGDAHLRALSEEELDVQRELALERRRERYRPEDYDKEQFEWLDAALAESERERPGNWRIVYLHHPLYTTIGNHCERPDVLGLRENLLALLQKQERVHLVLSGHSHAFEWFRSSALPNTGIFVTGGGGQMTLRGSILEPSRLRRRRDRYDALCDAGIEETASAGAGPTAEDGAAEPLYHYLRIVVRPDTLEIHPVGVRRQGDEDSNFRREEPMPVFHTPRLPASPSRPPFNARRLECVVLRRGQAPEAKWSG